MCQNCMEGPAKAHAITMSGNGGTLILENNQLMKSSHLLYIEIQCILLLHIRFGYQLRIINESESYYPNTPHHTADGCKFYGL